ncbi:hypothetical protein [Paenibacillus sp. LK1]|uniref:hypothetical protein n=1 Tax=Paenibacillus sp. LK1 TaxID=2053014 RepID=UPI000C1A896E|nr:hypothetical protein [Paenibacillus sp. LK1]PIH61103.1 hypothetical protein CS562_01380 [Paenibacillus sp. LK1]
MTTFTCEFYLASDSNLRNTFKCKFSDWEIGQFGALYSENMLLSLGRHFNLYTNGSNNGFEVIRNTYTGKPVGRFNMLGLKKKAPLVSGNIGEAIAMPALTACCKVPIYNMPFQRFKSTTKCPDYRFETVPHLLSLLWDLPRSTFSSFPSSLPMEVKTHLGDSQKYPITALHQLKSYWHECADHYHEGIGFGVISRVNLKSNLLKYFLFIPKGGVANPAILNAKYKTFYNKPGRYFEV